MPTDTFFRLPEEKRARILEGAWSEFTAVPYAEASINRIVQTSRIPRGSFYQYFEDKNDLFLTLIDEIRDQFLDLFHDTLERSGGDLFSMPLVLLDAMVAPSGCITPAFSRAFALLSLNVNMDVQQLFFERAAGELCPQKLRYLFPSAGGEANAHFRGRVERIYRRALRRGVHQPHRADLAHPARQLLPVFRG